MKTYTVKSNARRAAKAAGIDLNKVYAGADGRGYHIDTTDVDVGALLYRYNGMARELAALGSTRHKERTSAFDDVDQGIEFCGAAASSLRAHKTPDKDEPEAVATPQAEVEDSVSTEPQQEAPPVTTKAKRTKKAPANGHAKAPKAKTKAPKGDHGAKTAAIGKLLARKNGCTTADVLELTGWPSVSMPAIAKNLKVKLRKEKEKGARTRYYAG